MIRDAIILGAGAAGLMCSMTAGRRGFSCAVIEHSPPFRYRSIMSSVIMRAL